jgi:hypothetical protein
MGYLNYRHRKIKSLNRSLDGGLFPISIPSGAMLVFMENLGIISEMTKLKKYSNYNHNKSFPQK